jgi:hypothetical protein
MATVEKLTTLMLDWFIEFFDIRTKERVKDWTQLNPELVADPYRVELYYKFFEDIDNVYYDFHGQVQTHNGSFVKEYKHLYSLHFWYDPEITFMKIIIDYDGDCYLISDFNGERPVRMRGWDKKLFIKLHNIFSEIRNGQIQRIKKGMSNYLFTKNILQQYGVNKD